MSDTYSGMNPNQKRRIRSAQRAFRGDGLLSSGAVPSNIPRSEPRQDTPQQSDPGNQYWTPPINRGSSGQGGPNAPIEMNSAGVAYVMGSNRALVRKDIDEILTGDGDISELRTIFEQSGGSPDAEENEVRQFAVSVMREMDMRQNAMQNQQGEGQAQSMMGMAEQAAANAPPQSILGQASEEAMQQGGSEGELSPITQRMDQATEQVMAEQTGGGAMYDPEKGTYVDGQGNAIYFDQKRRTYTSGGQR